MSRFGSLGTQYFDNSGDVLSGGKIHFYESGTTTLKNTFTDSNETTANTNPVILTADGRQPNIFFSGSAKGVLSTSAGVIIETRDPIGAIDPLTAFEAWSSTFNYSISDIVTGSDLAYYASRTNGNQGNNPADDANPEDWTLLHLPAELVFDLTPQLGGNLSANGHQIQWSKGADVASATALPVLTDGNYFNVTGTTTVTSINTTAAGTVIKLHFDAALVLTHNATSLVLPGGDNITTAANDEAEFIEYSTGNWRCTSYAKASGTSVISSVASILVVPRTSNTVINSSNRSNLIDITEGTFSQTFAGADTMGDGFFCYIRNSGTGDITLDPVGTIDGLTSFVVYPGEMRMLLVNAAGDGFESFVMQGFKKSITSSETFTKPPGYKTFCGILWSAGASGRNGGGAINSGGGAGGGAFPFSIDSSDFGATETITIGAGGAAVTTSTVGNVGGNSTIGSLLTVFAGSTWVRGGAIGITSAFSESSAEISSFAGSITSSGGSTIWGGAAADANASGASGSSIYGGGAGGGVDSSEVVRAAGTSKFGGNGGAASVSGNGTAGAQPGGGGGSTKTGTQSGAGGDGQCDIWGLF